MVHDHETCSCFLLYPVFCLSHRLKLLNLELYYHYQLPNILKHIRKRNGAISSEQCISFLFFKFLSANFFICDFIRCINLVLYIEIFFFSLHSLLIKDWFCEIEFYLCLKAKFKKIRIICNKKKPQLDMDTKTSICSLKSQFIYLFGSYYFKILHFSFRLHFFYVLIPRC